MLKVTSMFPFDNIQEKMPVPKTKALTLLMCSVYGLWWQAYGGREYFVSYGTVGLILEPVPGLFVTHQCLYSRAIVYSVYCKYVNHTKK